MTKKKGCGIHLCISREPTFWERLRLSTPPLKTLVFAFLVLLSLAFIASW